MKLLLSFCASLALATSAMAETNFPTKSVTLVVPTSPGGIIDTAARLLADGLTKKWNQPVIIENKPGAGGSIGAAYAQRAAPDGYTILIDTNAEFALNPIIYPNLTYTAEDFRPLIIGTYNPMAVIANINSPYKTLDDLIKAAKDAPETISWASAGAGTWNHFAGEWLEMISETKMVHVPYKGGGPASTAVASGDVPIGLLSITSALPLLESGKVRVLAVTSGNRLKFDESWPTVSEIVGKPMDAVNWVGAFAPSGIDPAVAEKIETDIKAILDDPKTAKRLNAIGAEAGGMKGTEMIGQIKKDADQAKLIAEHANISSN